MHPYVFLNVHIQVVTYQHQKEFFISLGDSQLFLYIPYRGRKVMRTCHVVAYVEKYSYSSSIIIIYTGGDILASEGVIYFFRRFPIISIYSIHGNRSYAHVSSSSQRGRI